MSNARRLVQASAVALFLATAAVASPQSVPPPAGALPPPPPATGQTTTSAQAAFNRGMEHMRNKRFHLACPEFKNSLALAQDMATQFRLAECYEETGRVGSAWKNFNEVAAQAERGGEADKAALARERAAKLVPRLSRVRVQVPSEFAVEQQLEVRIGERVLTRDEWGKPVVVDAAKYTVSVTGPGCAPWSQEVEVAEKGTVDIQVPGPVLPPPDSDIGSGPDPGPVPPPPLSPSWPERHVGSLITAGAGAAIALAGIGVAAATLSQYKDLSRTCAGTALGCSQDDKDSVSTKARATNVLLGVAGAVGVGAVVLYFVEGDSTEQVGVSVGPAGVFVRGTF